MTRGSGQGDWVTYLILCRQKVAQLVSTSHVPWECRHHAALRDYNHTRMDLAPLSKDPGLRKELGVETHTCPPRTVRLKQDNYSGSSSARTTQRAGPGWATKRDPVSKWTLLKKGDKSTTISWKLGLWGFMWWWWLFQPCWNSNHCALASFQYDYTTIQVLSATRLSALTH